MKAILANSILKVLAAHNRHAPQTSVAQASLPAGAGSIPAPRSIRTAEHRARMPGSPAGRDACATPARNNFPQFTDAQLFNQFIGGYQKPCFRDALRGEEGEEFQRIRARLCQILRTMPMTYETEKVPPDEKIAYLHYFTGGRANHYICELDKGNPDENGKEDPAEFQWQMWGLCDPFGDGGELGYVCLQELLPCNAELDFHWTPKTIKEIRKEH